MMEKTLGLTVDEWMGMYHIAADRADKAEAEVERLTDLLDHYNAKCAICDCADDITTLQTENAKLRKVAEAAKGVCALCPVRDTCVPDDCWVWPIKVALKEGER